MKKIEHNQFLVWLYDEIERRALHCEELANKEDQKPGPEKNLGRLYGCHIASRQLRELSQAIKLEQEFQTD